MKPDLRSTLHRLAPSPMRTLDVSSLVREGHHRRRVRYMAFTGATLTLVVAAALVIPNLMQAQPERAPATPVSPDASAIPTPTSNAPAPVFENLGPGWTKLESPPEAQPSAVSVWSGRQSSGRDLVLWAGESGSGTVTQNNGFTWDPNTNAWSPMSDSPLEARAGSGAVFTGSEVVIWGGYGQWPELFSDGAAYDPATDTWRMLPQAPLAPASPLATVWTGEEVLVWGSTDRFGSSTEGAAYNPATNDWRNLPDAPAPINEGTAVWTSQDPNKPQEMVIFGAQLDGNNASKLDHAIGIAYNPQSNEWRKLPNVDLSPNASAIAWTGDEIIAWDYGMVAAAYDPGRDRWRELPDVPLEQYECYPSTEFVGGYVFAWFCGQAALFDVDRDEWTPIDTPKQIVAGDPVVAGEVLLFAGATHEADHNMLWLYAPPGKP